MRVQHDWVLDRDECPIAEHPTEQTVDAINRGNVTAADGIHLDDLAIEQFEPVVVAENAGLGHALELGHREALGNDVGDHGAIPRHRL